MAVDLAGLAMGTRACASVQAICACVRVYVRNALPRGKLILCNGPRSGGADM